MTLQQVFDAAVSWSLKEAPSGVTVSEEEATDIINFAASTFFLVGARFNPEALAVNVDLTGTGGVWALPSTQPPTATPATAFALLVFNREVVASGAKLHVVPVSQRNAAHPRPAVYQQGRNYVTAGNANDPTGAAIIRIDFVRAPVPGTDLAASVDALIPDDFKDMLGLETAIHLAIKDNRNEEVIRLIPLRDKWALRWGAYLEAISVGTTRLWDAQFASPNLIGLGGILAGGSTLDGTAPAAAE